MSAALSLKDLITEAKSRIAEVDVHEAQKLMGDGYRVLDVREPAEYLSGTIEGAVHIPRGTLEPACDLEYPGRNPDLQDRAQPWLILCRSGGRAALATEVMQQMGFSSVKNIIGGMLAWQEADLPVTIPSDEHSLVQLKEPCYVD